MTPWERLTRELRRRRKKLVQFAEGIGVSRQTLNNWRDRGIPSSRLHDCAAYLGRSVEWLELGHEASPDLVSAVQSLAQHLESLDPKNRATVVSLLTTLVNSPQLYLVVVDGLLALQNNMPKSSIQDAES
jgi:hypothetical protein